MKLVTAKEMQNIDQTAIQTFGIPGSVLMENAGRGATRVLIEQLRPFKNKKVGIAAGGGNNGGDGFVIARYLYEKGIETTVFLLSTKEKIKGDAKLNLNLVEKLPIPIIEIPDLEAFNNNKSQMAHQTIWVDAIFGTGLNSDIRGHYKDIIDYLNDTGKPVFSVDIPSGLNSNTGQICGTCINADITATFAFAKTGHILYPGATCTGKLEIIDIGIPRHIADAINPNHFLITKEYLNKTYIPRSVEAHKGNTGHLLVIAGAPGKTGAAAMAANAALRTGTGLVTLACPESLTATLETLSLEVMTSPLAETKNGTLSDASFDAIMSLIPGKKCIAIGPGIGTDPQTQKLVKKIITNCPVPIVIDADGLNCLADDANILTNLKIPILLTPHPGEMARLTDTTTTSIQKNRIQCAREFATKHDVHLVLKGARTIIAGPDGKIYINPTGNPGMASAGMGDILTGIISGLIAQGFSAEVAAITGVFIHGAAADELAETVGRVGYTASDILYEIPEQLDKILDYKASENDPVFATKLY